jgi:hypothetical protein
VLWAIVAPIAHAFPHLRTNSLRVSSYAQAVEVWRAQRTCCARHAQTCCVATDCGCTSWRPRVVVTYQVLYDVARKKICDETALTAVST